MAAPAKAPARPSESQMKFLRMLARGRRCRRGELSREGTGDKGKFPAYYWDDDSFEVVYFHLGEVARRRGWITINDETGLVTITEAGRRWL